jgi:hypothetical protein
MIRRCGATTRGSPLCKFRTVLVALVLHFIGSCSVLRRLICRSTSDLKVRGMFSYSETRISSIRIVPAPWSAKHMKKSKSTKGPIAAMMQSTDQHWCLRITEMVHSKPKKRNLRKCRENSDRVSTQWEVSDFR